jgi:hypothetical protein
VSPCESTRTVAPIVELDAVFTTAAAPAAVWDPPDPLAPGELLELVPELLPHAASRSDTATAGTNMVI